MTVDLHTAYANKKAFLTGHTGFKGSWMLAVLQYFGAEVKGYALEPEGDPNLFDLIVGNSLCASAIADINDGNKLEGEIIDFQPDYIFHFAAQSLVRRSYKEPLGTFSTNAMGTANLLEAVRKLENECAVIVVTTDKVYENLEKDYAYKETDKLGGFDPYSSSKACAEIIASSYRSSFFNPADFEHHKKSIATARSGNVIGGGDWSEDRIIPDMVRALEAGKSLIVRNPQAIRPWQHVLDPLGGYLQLGALMARDPGKYAESFNFGPDRNDKLSVEELVKTALKEWGSGLYETKRGDDEPHEADLLMLDITKAGQALGWAPKMNASKAISAAVKWYRDYRKDPLACTMEQIKTYFG